MINISETFVDNFKTDFMFNNLFPKIVPIKENVEKYGRKRQGTYNNIIRRMHFKYGINKATDT